MKAVMYHYVRKTEKHLPHFRHLEVDDFCSQLDYFSRESGFVTRDDFLDCFENDRPLPSGFVLTFDDAFSDHFDYVYSIL
ncbi:MAG: hypothetical protein O3A00_15015 [Planctomycetota bacterium]|nr:hypothetical protein [Planctomycetota bacterium]